MKGRRIGWQPRELAFIERRQTWGRTKLHAAFVKKFGRDDVSLAALCSLCKRNRWRTAPRKGRFKGRRLKYTKAELRWIEQRQTTPRRELHEQFLAAFPRHAVSLKAFKQLCKVKGFKTGRDGRLVKGNVPANKGKKMPFNANSARTQFKKGHRGGTAVEKYKPIGTERVSREGYRERKIHDGFPMQSRWKAVHRIEWEEVNGPIPAGMALKCKGDIKNTAPSNWELVPRGLLPRLNGKASRGRAYDQAPAELKPTIMAVAKLEHRMAEHSRRAR